MNTLVIVLIAAVCLVCAYAGYGRWIAKSWGIDPNAKTPAVRLEDGKDYVPTNGWTVFSHQFSSIAGAGPVTGAIQAAAFGWLPVLLWVLLGGIFFGAVTDFGALYASVKNDGKSMGMLIEKYIGKLGRRLFLLFCWLFTLLVIAAFADMVADTFNAYTTTDGVASLAAAATTNGAAGMVSIMFMVFAVVFGLIQKKFNFDGWKEAVLGIVFIVLSFLIGSNFPIILAKEGWIYITFIYIFFAAVLPMWLLKQPRDYMTTFMFIAMIAGAAIGLLRQTVYYDRYVKTAYAGSPLQYHFGRTTHQLYGSKWGIVGLGNIGRSVARVAEALGCRIAYTSTSGVVREEPYPEKPLDELLRWADVVSVHAPLNDRTRNLIGARELALMKPSAILINVARGGIVDEAALAAALDAGRLAGAGLDVFTHEPLEAGNPLLSVREPDRLLLSPHNAWSPVEAIEILVECIARNIRDFYTPQNQ